MTELSATTMPPAERPGNIGLLLALAGLLVGAAVALTFVATDKAQPLILGLLALLAVAGVFFLFAVSVGLIQVAGKAQHGDIARLIIDAAEEGMLLVGADGRPLYANEAYLVLSADQNEANVKPIERLLDGSPEASEALYRLSQAARDGRSAVEEIRLSPALEGRGEVGWYRVRVRPVGTGRRGASLWSVADITRDRERQENVFQELQHAIDYLDHAPAGFLSVNTAGQVVYMNATLASWLDYDLAQVGSGGMQLSGLVNPNGEAMLLSTAGKPGEVRTETFDLDFRRKGGQAFPVRLFHRVTIDWNGQPSASSTLVLDRSMGTEGDAGEHARAAEVRFSRFFNNTPFAIATVTRDGRIERANASFARLLNQSGQHGAPIGSRIQSLIVERERQAFDVALKAIAEGQGDVAPIDAALEGDGGRSARFYMSAVSDADSDGEAAAVYVLEITEQRQLEQQFAQAQKMNAIGQLAGGVAHDFNNVLQAIIGYSDLLLANHRPTDPAFQDIMQIKQNANRAAGLVRQLLAFSRRQTLRPEVIELGEVLSDISLLLKRLLGERVDLDLKHGRDLWLVKADVNQFEQVIVNLAVNARDAMPQGGKLTIRTMNIPSIQVESMNRQGLPVADYVEIAVSDTGTGITPEVLDKIFEPFFTTKDVGKGTGLGLSTVFGIVKQSGGYIYCDSVVGQGTTFRIFWPRHIQEPVQESEAKPEAAKPEAAKPVADMTGSGVVLLVEDEDPVRAVNARALTARGYTVLEAASGVEALAIVDERKTPVDVVVSDVVMPEMDGPTLLKELRQRYPKLKIIFVSGYAEDAFKKNLPEGEDFSFLPKPFSLKQLVEAVKQRVSEG